jgi:AraC-like DNA-binding protein
VAVDFKPIRLSTADLPARGRDEIIRDYYGRIAQRTELELAAGETPLIDVEAHLYDGLSVGGGTVGRMWGRRTAEMRQDGASDVVISFMAGGAVLSETGRGDVTVARGDALVSAFDRPMAMYMPEQRNRFLTVQLSRERLEPLLPEVDDRLGRSAPAALPAMQLLRSYAATLAAHPPAEVELRRMAGRHVLQLAALALGSGGHAELVGGVKAARLAEAKAMVRRRFEDTRLSAEMVARHLGVSPRYLHMLFEPEGRSFSEFVADVRLRQAAQMLATAPRRRVIDIALDCGFGDVRTFNRAFRRAYGCTPSDARGRPLS